MGYAVDVMAEETPVLRSHDSVAPKPEPRWTATLTRIAQLKEREAAVFKPDCEIKKYINQLRSMIATSKITIDIKVVIQELWGNAEVTCIERLGSGTYRAALEAEKEMESEDDEHEEFPKESKQPVQAKGIICEGCGETFFLQIDEKSRRFCTRKCDMDSRWKKEWADKKIPASQVAEEYRAGDSIPTIAKKYGVSTAGLSTVLRQHGVEMRTHTSTQTCIVDGCGEPAKKWNYTGDGKVYGRRCAKHDREYRDAHKSKGDTTDPDTGLCKCGKEARHRGRCLGPQKEVHRNGYSTAVATTIKGLTPELVTETLEVTKATRVTELVVQHPKPEWTDEVPEPKALPPAPRSEGEPYIPDDPPELKELAELTVTWFADCPTEDEPFNKLCQEYNEEQGPRLAQAVMDHRKAKEIVERHLKDWLVLIQDAGMVHLYTVCHAAVLEAITTTRKKKE